MRAKRATGFSLKLKIYKFYNEVFGKGINILKPFSEERRQMLPQNGIKPACYQEPVLTFELQQELANYHI